MPKSSDMCDCCDECGAGCERCANVGSPDHPPTFRLTMYLYVNDPNPETEPGKFSLKTLYKTAATSHNNSINANVNPDSGFDLFYPHPSNIVGADGSRTTKIDFQVVCAFRGVPGNSVETLPYYMYPRSSLSKTGLRLANNVGIIDAGYRGNLCGYFDLIQHASLDKKGDGQTYTVEQEQRLVQVCSCTLVPFKVVVCDSIEELGDTARGTGGFGSSGSTGVKTD